MLRETAKLNEGAAAVAVAGAATGAVLRALTGAARCGCEGRGREGRAGRGPGPAASAVLAAALASAVLLLAPAGQAVAQTLPQFSIAHTETTADSVVFTITLEGGTVPQSGIGVPISFTETPADSGYFNSNAVATRTLTINPGDTTTVVNVARMTDTAIDNPVTLTVGFPEFPQGFEIASGSAGGASTVVRDWRPTFSLGATFTDNTADGTVDMTITRMGSNVDAVTLQYTVMATGTNPPERLVQLTMAAPGSIDIPGNEAMRDTATFTMNDTDTTLALARDPDVFSHITTAMHQVSLLDADTFLSTDSSRTIDVTTDIHTRFALDFGDITDLAGTGGTMIPVEIFRNNSNREAVTLPYTITSRDGYVDAGTFVVEFAEGDFNQEFNLMLDSMRDISTGDEIVMTLLEYDASFCTGRTPACANDGAYAIQSGGGRGDIFIPAIVPEVGVESVTVDATGATVTFSRSAISSLGNAPLLASTVSLTITSPGGYIAIPSPAQVLFAADATTQMQTETLMLPWASTRAAAGSGDTLTVTINEATAESGGAYIIDAAKREGMAMVADLLPFVQIAPSSATPPEDRLHFTLSRAGAAHGAVTVMLNLTGNAAAENSYVVAGQLGMRSVMIPAGAAMAEVTVEVMLRDVNIVSLGVVTATVEAVTDGSYVVNSAQMSAIGQIIPEAIVEPPLNLAEVDRGSGDVLVEGDPSTVSRYAAGDTLGSTPVAVGQPAAGEFGTLRIMADGAWTYRPGAGARALKDGATMTDTGDPATDTFTYEVVAAGGSGGGGADLTTTYTNTLTIMLIGTNDGPMAGESVEDFHVFLLEELDRDLGDTFADPEGEPLTFSATLKGGAALSTSGWLSFDPATQQLTGRPLEQHVGDYTVVLTATDVGADDTAGNADDLSATEEFVVSVVSPLGVERDRNVSYALGIMARDMGWDAVDAVRDRVGLDTGAARLDVASVVDQARARLRERFMGHAVAGPAVEGIGAGFEGVGKGSGASVNAGFESLAGAGAPGLPRALAGAREALNNLAFGGDLVDAISLPPAGVGALDFGSADFGSADFSSSALASSMRDGDHWLPPGGRVWASYSASDIELQPIATLKFAGDSVTTRVGFERRRGNGVSGVALSLYDGKVNFTDTAQAGEGRAEVSQWFVSPYASRETDTARVWGMVGLGLGELDYRDNYRRGVMEAGSSDTWMGMAAAGAEFDFVAQDVVNLVGRVEAMTVQMSANEDEDQTALGLRPEMFSSQDIEAHGLRGELELGWNVQMADGPAYRPYITTGYRWDEGAGAEGWELEHGLGVTVRGAAFTLDASTRIQAGGDDDSLDMDSYSIDIGYDRGGDGMGLTVNLRNSLSGGAAINPFAGAAAYGNAYGSYGNAYNDDKARETLDLETGYGIGTRLGVVRPHASAAFDGSRLDRARLGVTLDAALGRVELLHTLRLAQPGAAADSEHALELRANYRF